MGKLESKNLNKAYKELRVVKNVSLNVSSGEVVGLLGPNGAGKTTCFYLIVGLIPSDSGELLLNGENITRLPIHKRSNLGISYLPQESSIFRNMTVEENIQSILEIQKNSSKINRNVDMILNDLNIIHLKKNQAISLSGGERRRTEIARALATNPKFILLDEPFAGVDPISVVDIQRIIKFLREKNIGVLITDHNVRETLGICDRAYIISEGSILACGNTEEIIKNEKVRKVYLGENFSL